MRRTTASMEDAIHAKRMSKFFSIFGVVDQLKPSILSMYNEMNCDSHYWLRKYVC